ncbi:molecular chaperone OsmY [Pantoea sp. Nvir]|uniref:molecular chaperone OsmY n=1 Tax=Pantoea sp. Nvir TaxID=2576760 RepID=UPI0013599171|nr:molecular chaperone OsmY [Pantoea sp. Nvir]MXP66770.1 molecular chaperone OsmY [Pantoea sp. Nvir]CAJ0990890.1 Osmotically-inducible protein Y [Pantoea sp. Nvir]
MNKTKIIGTLMTVVVVSSTLLNNKALAVDSLSQQARQSANNFGKKINGSMKKIDGFMDDSVVTAKVKAALLYAKKINSTNISVNTNNGVVTLSGFVTSKDQIKKVIAVVQKIEGVQSVSDKLHVKESNLQSLKRYPRGDTVITREIKAQFLADNIITSHNITVKTINGIVKLSGTVATKTQSDHAESIAKEIEGVKSVENNLTIRS